MAYRFKLKEHLQASVRRIAVEQLDKVLAAPRERGDRVEWVHDVRKAMKRLRALLRCVRAGLGEKAFRQENAALRLIARNLSGLRDRDVMAATMTALSGRDKDLDEALDWLGSRLAPSNASTSNGGSRAAGAVVKEAVKALEAARERLGSIDVDGDLAEVVAAGLRTCQRTGREAVERLALDPTDENVHELRKAVQTYWRQHALVQSAWPELSGVRVTAAKELSQIFGDAQDLAVLAAAARQHVTDDDPRASELAERVVAASRKRQAELREIAIPMATRLFATKPKAVAAELADQWGAAIDLSRAAARMPAEASTSDDQPRKAAKQDA